MRDTFGIPANADASRTCRQTRSETGIAWDPASAGPHPTRFKYADSTKPGHHHPLEKGDTVVVWAEAIGTHTAIQVRYEGAGFEEVTGDNDSALAPVAGSTNEVLHYKAPISGTYYILVADALGQNGGAYFVRVRRADSLG